MYKLGEKMKINSTYSNIALKAPHLQSRNFGEKNTSRGYNAEYCGSFTGKSEAATSFLDKILKSRWFGKFAEYTHEHNISTTALIALILAGVLRPAAIMALPGDKDKDDKTYAAGHAMASGIIGFLVSTAITSPFDESIKKVFDKDSKFIGPKLRKLNEEIDGLRAKEEAKTIVTDELNILENLVNKRNAKNVLLKNIPDWIIAVPRAMLTIALIPPILKYVFGMEKKSKLNNQQAVVQNQDFIEKPVFSQFRGGVITVTPLNNNYKPNFTAAPRHSVALDAAERELVRVKESGFFKPFEKAYNGMTDNIAKNFTSKVAEWNVLEKLADKFKDSKNLFQYCITIGSVITSGLYMQQTYTNKKLDKDRRNTLVVNQGLTLAVSTAGAYMLDKYLKNWWENVTARFAGFLLDDDNFSNDFVNKKNTAKQNHTELPKLEKLIQNHKRYKTLTEADAKSLMNKIKGMGPLRSMIVFGFVYRFFVPLAVTKPANKLCEMYLEHKKAKDAQKTNNIS